MTKDVKLFLFCFMNKFDFDVARKESIDRAPKQRDSSGAFVILLLHFVQEWTMFRILSSFCIFFFFPIFVLCYFVLRDIVNDSQWQN